MKYFLEEIRDAEAWSEPGRHDRRRQRASENPGLLF